MKEMKLDDIILKEVKVRKKTGRKAGNERIPKYAVIESDQDTSTVESLLKKNKKWSRQMEDNYIRKRCKELNWKYIEPIKTRIHIPTYGSVASIAPKFGLKSRGHGRDVRYSDMNRYDASELRGYLMDKAFKHIALLWRDVFYPSDAGEWEDKAYEADGVVYKSQAIYYCWKVYRNMKTTFDAFQYLESAKEYVETTQPWNEHLIEYIRHLQVELGFDIEADDMWSDIITRTLSEQTMKKAVKEDENEIVFEYGNITVKYAK